ncbi:CDP-alcohol phosphatidyltransferase family protein [Thermocrinis minervae]|uniref:Phosphatidylglycerophosphate synthase n=1 Tax=Thermocrinis minervae TaxID=381751 RepID=A0A1M6RU84_9AQUI|nr:CDP-alcohol phosphatidyltransferase family protein [Thermocrinis minervae]SHK36006.1 Phosphatidylglycerophosphate synthase [Thermocrinis minervae]
MNLTNRRESLKKIYTPVGVLLYRLGFPPNLITLLSLMFGMASAYAFYEHKLLTGAFLLAMSGLFDLLDGTVARLSDRPSKFGAVFDWVVDKWVDGFVFGVVAFFYSSPFVAITLITSSMIHSFIKPTVYSEIGYQARIKGKIQDPLEGVGFFGRPESHITLIIFTIFERFNLPLGLSFGVKLITVLTLTSLILRIVYLYKHFGREYE